MAAFFVCSRGKRGPYRLGVQLGVGHFMDMVFSVWASLIPVVLFDLVVDGVHEHKRVHLLQRTVLPGRHFGHNFPSDLTDRLRGDFHIVKFFDLLGNIPLAHPTGVQRKDLFFHPFCVPVVFADDFRLILSLPVSWYLDIHFSQLGLDRLPRVSVAVIP